MDISPKAQNKQDTIDRPHEAQEEGRPKCGCLVFSKKGNKTLTGAIMEKKCGAENEGKASPETVLPGDSFYKYSPNPNTIVDAKKCLLKGA